jgi:membrane associated rhomboid family serine protease
MFVRIQTRRRSSVAWATIAISLICFISFLVFSTYDQMHWLQMLNRWGTVPTAIMRGGDLSWAHFLASRPETLLTSILIHANWLHLLGNILFLLIFGLSSERLLGSWRFLALFFICGAMANFVGVLVLGQTNAPIVGASGAVSAIVGTYLALFPRSKLGLVIPLGLYLEFVKVPASLLIGIWVLLQIIFSFVGPSFGAVVWAVHIAGFIAGVFFALFSRPAIAKRLRR